MSGLHQIQLWSYARRGGSEFGRRNEMPGFELADLVVYGEQFATFGAGEAQQFFQESQ